MARISQTCGKVSIEFEDTCGYACNCGPIFGCSWIVACPDGHGGLTYTQGTAQIAPKPHHLPQVTVCGNLEAIAHALGKIWRRPVLVPDKLLGKKIRGRTIKGSPAVIAQALGFELGPSRRARGSSGKA
ncbi:MAG TPA: hypothetical protein VE779_06055 [Candidatus Angelobacter sp.]|jgi:hypothetical protein|nr:hypothetical protein [Candidatus Angelobacter sp.]